VGVAALDWPRMDESLARCTLARSHTGATACITSVNIYRRRSCFAPDADNSSPRTRWRRIPCTAISTILSEAWKDFTLIKGGKHDELEQRFCSNPSCKYAAWIVKRDPAAYEVWWVAVHVDGRPFTIAAPDPVCPRCGTTLCTPVELEGTLDRHLGVQMGTGFDFVRSPA
jgi:hypothetical protein